MTSRADRDRGARPDASRPQRLPPLEQHLRTGQLRLFARDSAGPTIRPRDVLPFPGDRDRLPVAGELAQRCVVGVLHHRVELIAPGKGENVLKIVPTSLADAHVRPVTSAPFNIPAPEMPDRHHCLHGIRWALPRLRHVARPSRGRERGANHARGLLWYEGLPDGPLVPCCPHRASARSWGNVRAEIPRYFYLFDHQ